MLRNFLLFPNLLEPINQRNLHGCEIETCHTMGLQNYSGTREQTTPTFNIHIDLVFIKLCLRIQAVKLRFSTTMNAQFYTIPVQGQVLNDSYTP